MQLAAIRQSVSRRAALAGAVSLCAFHFTSFDVARQPIVTDVRFFLYFAWRVSEGAVPHLDYFENKTALATFVGAALYRAGAAVGADPLLAIRWGYLLLTALAGLAAFSIHRRLGGGRAVAGGLGLLAFCSFGLLGVMPAVGNVPKLLMALGGSMAALLAFRRAWFWAGVAGALAFMDWQIGGLVVLAVLATAAVHGRPRLVAVGRAAGGVLAGLAPFVVYFAAHGALGPAVAQVVGSTLFRGSTSLGQHGLSNRLAKIASVVDETCPGRQALFYLGGAGIAVTTFWLWRRRQEEVSRLLLPLAIYHAGVVGFSLVDFQNYGDLFVLLHSAAFFLGLAWVAAWRGLDARLTPRHRSLAALLALGLAFALARPGPLRPRFELRTPIAAPGAVLADQRSVALELDARLGARNVAFLDNSELLFLMRRQNTLPLAYWNIPAWFYFREGPVEPFPVTCERLLHSVDAGAVVLPRGMGDDDLLRRGYSIVPLASANGRYAVRVALRGQ